MTNNLMLSVKMLSLIFVALAIVLISYCGYVALKVIAVIWEHDGSKQSRGFHRIIKSES